MDSPASSNPLSDFNMSQTLMLPPSSTSVLPVEELIRQQGQTPPLLKKTKPQQAPAKVSRKKPAKSIAASEKKVRKLSAQAMEADSVAYWLL